MILADARQEFSIRAKPDCPYWMSITMQRFEAVPCFRVPEAYGLVLANARQNLAARLKGNAPYAVGMSLQDS
jgi:hypothetical protein